MQNSCFRRIYLKPSVFQPTPDSSKKRKTQSQHHVQTVVGKTHHTMKQTAKMLKNTIQLFMTKSLTTSNKSQDNIRLQKSQKRITIASMTVQNPILRQTIEVKSIQMQLKQLKLLTLLRTTAQEGTKRSLN
ncbi:Hypothetical_protein [Hexamita inflata]|uniref:Hypothetical_protein n=1 Tax=Hexamita inflata TaxID=28002 RepID=A0AA86TGB3_9EUKA|nr:Hypothetical protein HINF_LOCUS4440 [Hexamita inflata]